jgi:hypothetical protein
MNRLIAIRNGTDVTSDESFTARKSNRISKPRVMLDYDYEKTETINLYVLNKEKALQQKLDACSRPVLTTQAKNRGQLRLKFSAAGYEAFKINVSNMYLNNSNSEMMNDLSVKHTVVKDKNGEAVVQELFSIYNKLKNGT